jgi:hypothetical protein
LNALTFAACPWDADPTDPVARGRMITLPPEVSLLLPTRGMSYAHVLIGDTCFGTPVEPDGQGRHWFALPSSIAATCTGEVCVQLTIASEWPEPIVPPDFIPVLETDPAALAIWRKITPAARWDWIRWAGTARQAETRARRVESIPSRLRAGKRRPCCFDRNQCSLTLATP